MKPNLTNATVIEWKVLPGYLGKLFLKLALQEKGSAKLTIGSVIGFINIFHYYKLEELPNSFLTFKLMISGLLWIYVRI